MKIKDLIEEIAYERVCGSLSGEVLDITERMDSRKAKKGDAFVCIRGARFDSHSFIPELISEEVALLVVEKDVVPGLLVLPVLRDCTTAIIAVEDTRLAKAQLMAAWWGHPARALMTIGVTGSKGKTTTTHMLAEILREAGNEVGTIGTNGVIFADQCVELNNSTPDSDEVQYYLRQMVDAGCTCAVIECSSQGLMQHRVSGFTFDYGVFTNIAEGDHISPIEHKDFADYLYCKSRLLCQCKRPFVNVDDAHYEELMTLLERAHAETVCTYSAEGNPEADYYAQEIEERISRFRPQVFFKAAGRIDGTVCVNFPGRFQVGNALAAVAVCTEMGISLEAVGKALSEITIKGRIDMVYESERLRVCVDFAHNGYSTRNLLIALRSFEPKRLVCVFGADGNRSRSRRFEMGEASGNLADLSIVTSGHNRYETFEQIFQDIAVGLGKTKGSYVVIPDRKEAIRYAIDHVEDGDLIAIIGLGHETYQEENGIKYPYSDTDYVRSVIAEKFPEAYSEATGGAEE